MRCAVLCCAVVAVGAAYAVLSAVLMLRRPLQQDCRDTHVLL
jgi:hypothetical protein